MDTKDYVKIFEQASELLVVIDTDFAIVDASDAFLQATTTVRENIVGRNALDLFLDNTEDKTANGESIVRASFNRVLKNKTKDVLPVVKYDIPKPESEGGGYEVKYWQANNSPVLDEMNNVKYIILRAEDFTENKTLITQHDFDKKALILLEESEKRHNMMLMQSPFAFAVLKGENKVIAFANDKMKATWSKGNNVEGKSLIEVLPELKDTSFPDLLDEVYKTGIPYLANEVLAPKYMNGQKEDVYYNFVYQPYREADETISGVTIIAAEVTAAVLVKKALEVQHDVEQKALKQIEDSEKRYNMMLMKSPFGFAILKGKNLVITLANDSIKIFWGKGKDVEGKPLFDVIPELKDSSFPALIEKVYNTGIPFYGDELLAPIFRNGKWEDVYFNFVYQPYLEADETISGVTVIAYEVTAQVMVKKALEAQSEAEKKALSLVEETNKRYYSMLMDSPFAFCVMKEKDMIVTLANDLIKDFWGKGKDVEGKTILEVLPEIKDQSFPAMLDKVFTTGIPVYANEMLTILQHKDKMKERYFNIVYQPDHEADGTISGVITIAYDVTEMVLARKKIEESERHLMQVLDTMPQKITNYNAEGNIIYFNKKWVEDTGLEFEKSKGWGLEKVIHPDDLELTKTNWIDSIKTGDVFDMECRIINKEGQYKWHLSRAVPIKDETGKIDMWVGSNTDIHELKEAKSKAEVATQIAESAVIAKQQFLSNMSHEIRTPMNAIIGFTNVVLKTPLNKTQKEYINAIKISGDSLIVIINDILDIAKVDAGKMTFEQIQFALSDSISAMLLLFEPKIHEKNLELISTYDAAIPEILLGDPVRLRQIIINLLSNAVKFTDKGNITLSVRMLNQKADHVAIEFLVTDTGIGIHENKLGYIFDDFQQATNDISRLYGGTGLGLSIVKQFVELQGGTLIVNSKPGEGSTFGFILNFKKVFSETKEMAAITGTNHGVELTNNIQNIRILVAEDMPLNQLLIKIILEDFGFDVDIADNGKIAIEKLQENKYDLILMDLQMPELNGFEATEYIRNKMNAQIPIIALTADVTTVDVGKCEVVGMNDYISKPIDEKLLYSKIIRFLNKTN